MKAKKNYVVILIYFLQSVLITCLFAQNLSFTNEDVKLNWNISNDSATLTFNGSDKPSWSGSLLPAFWLMNQNDQRIFIKPGVLHEKSTITEDKGQLVLDFGKMGEGKLNYTLLNEGLRFTTLEVNWNDPVPMIISMYFGVSKLTGEQKHTVPDISKPFWPDWTAEGYCVPSAKGAPIQSFFRRWDFGHATIPLGNYGPSMGVPYAAAFPRPVYSASMGDDAGWMILGAGDIQDGAMSLKVKSSSGCIEYLYREDIWGISEGNSRTWNEPLRIFWADNAWDAFACYFNSFDADPINKRHQKSVWNTWGDWRKKDFDIRKTVDFGLKNGADVICFDDPWESFYGSDKPSMERFPEFFGVIDYVKSKGKGVGVWQTVGWIENPQKMGLTKNDLLIGVDGEPRKASWTFSANDNTFFCIDPSSENARQYLRERTRNIIETIGPELIKLDFAYGFPPPDVAAPRKPEFRGEKYPYTVFKIIADAAHEIDPDITIQYYSIHPLHKGQNLLSLDDLGDTWLWEDKGHDKWSIWAAHAGLRGAAITASTGYEWHVLPEILLNCAVLGAPGSVLPRQMEDTVHVPQKYISLFNAMSRWHRHTTGFVPLWLNSETGSLKAEPALNCWGRIEINGKDSVITALSLREKNKERLEPESINNIRFSKRWALISLDERSIFETGKLACIPFDQEAEIMIPMNKKPAKIQKYWLGYHKEYNDWQFNNNKLIINVQETEEWDTFLGFMVVVDDE